MLKIDERLLAYVPALSEVKQANYVVHRRRDLLLHLAREDHRHRGEQNVLLVAEIPMAHHWQVPVKDVLSHEQRFKLEGLSLMQIQYLGDAIASTFVVEDERSGGGLPEEVGVPRVALWVQVVLEGILVLCRQEFD